MAALIVFEGEGARVLTPEVGRERVGVGKQRVVDGVGLLSGDIKEHGPWDVERVAGLGVFHQRVFRLNLGGG